ncbi:helix-turn-helix domain-containing protein [Enterococcus crotali]|uniref:helix-turn-helix domain-containing protein n=1 Tax=Enterococcus crotali TaxID=1453587 RepID=UPI0004704CF3|nr:helix-turn-helix domain-containing protein [Enterococcus crotali]
MEKELNLEAFLTRVDSRRFSILTLFEQEHNDSLSVEQISLKLGLSERTIKRTIQDIQSDIETFGFSEKISLDLYRGDNSKLYCSLHYQLTFSIHYMLREYLKNSIFFLIIKDMFFDSSFSIKKAIDKYFVTNSTLRRYLKKIDQELQHFNLELSIKKELTIIGDEATIRLFYTSLFLKYTRESNGRFLLSHKKRSMIY